MTNQAASSWGTTFLFSILYDSYGKCLNSKTVDYDYGGIISTSITGLYDNSFLVSGIYNSSFISLDGITLLNSNNEQRGFLYKFNNYGDLIDAFQLEGSAGSKRIESVVHDSQGNIWITGENQADTLQIGQFSLFAEAPGEIFGYLARLNTDLEPDFVLKLNERSYNLILGEDDNIYLIEYLLQAEDDYRLYEIISPPNFVDNKDVNSKIDIAIYPNPVWNASHVNYKFLNPGLHLIERINVYNVHGIKLESRIVNANQGIIHIDSVQSLVFIEFLMENGSKVIKKVLANQ